jgi:hypothetical protein
MDYGIIMGNTRGTKVCLSIDTYTHYLNPQRPMAKLARQNKNQILV